MDDESTDGRLDALVLGGDLLIAAGWLPVAGEANLRPRLFVADVEIALRNVEIVRTTRTTDRSRPGFVVFADLEREPLNDAIVFGFDWRRPRCAGD